MPTHNQFDYLLKDESELTPLNQTSFHVGRNLYKFNDNGEELMLCHVPMFLPFARDDGKDKTSVSFGLSMSPAAMMAVDHWNNGNGAIVKDIEDMHKTCPIRLTTEIFDTERSSRKAMGDFIDLVSRKPGDDTYIRPCAILGSVYSDVTLNFAILTGLYDVLQVSPGSTSKKLDEDEKQYPLFARTIPSDGAVGANAVDYFRQMGIKNIAVVYADDVYGNAYNDVVKDRVAKYDHEMNSLSIPLRVEDITKDIAIQALEEIKKHNINYIIGAFFGNPFDVIMEAAYDLGIAGPNNLWLFCDDLAYDLFSNSRSYKKESKLAKAIFGNAVIVDKGGAPSTNSIDNEYDRFIKEWEKLGNNTTTLEYIASKQPSLSGGYSYSKKLTETFAKDPVFVSIYSYEAIVAIGISACEALRMQENNTTLVSSEDHYNQLLNINFVSASGRVTIAPNSKSRNSENILYTIANIIDISKDKNADNVTLNGIEHSYFDIINKRWKPLDTSRKFTFSDGSNKQPPEYVSPWWRQNTSSVVIFISALFVISVIFGYIGFRRIRKYTLPTVRVVSTGEMPVMNLPKNHVYHMFVSHVWSTGQARTHAIVRKLQLYLPGIKIWLDVDQLTDLYELEASIETSVVFVLFYSPGYFESANCRREIYAAIKFNKPIILLYEGGQAAIEKMKIECATKCLGKDFNDIPSSEKILEKLIGDNNANNCILWLNGGGFSAASLNKIYLSLLENLPYYQKFPFELHAGLAVPHEQLPVRLRKPINILVQKRQYSEHFALEMQSMLLSSYHECENINLIDIDDMISTNDHIDVEVQLLDNYETELLEVEATRDLNHQNINDNLSFFILYLNRETFSFKTADERRNLVNALKYCADKGVKILLVNETDASKGACGFDFFQTNAPAELLRPPIDLFHEISTPMYTCEKYREVSLRLLLLKMGGVPIRFRSGKWKMVRNLSKSINITTKYFFRKKTACK